MGVWVLEGETDADVTSAVLVDSVTEQAFGPLFADREEADRYLAWLASRGLGALALPSIVDSVEEWRGLPEPPDPLDDYDAEVAAEIARGE